MLSYVKIFVLFFGIFTVKSDIHREMSPDEIHQIFRRSDGSVPEYVVMRVDGSGIRQKRNVEKSIEDISKANELDSSHNDLDGVTSTNVESYGVTSSNVQEKLVEENDAASNGVAPKNPENNGLGPTDVRPKSVMTNMIKQNSVEPIEAQSDGAPNGAATISPIRSVNAGSNEREPISIVASNNVETNDVTWNKIIPITFLRNLSSNKTKLPTMRRIHFETRLFGQKINLWLNPSDGFLFNKNTPIYRAAYSSNETQKVKFTRRHGLMEEFSDLYEDPATFTSLVIGSKESGDIAVNGNIGSHNITIRSLPDHIVDRYVKNRRSTDKLYDLSENYSYHVAYKNEEAPGRNNDFSLKTERLQRSAEIDNDELPNYLYPEILVIVDYSMYQYHEEIREQSDIHDFLKYLVAFWNGVDLKFRSIKEPNIRLHVSGIVFSEDPRSTPYISENMITLSEFDSTFALTNASTFFYGVQNIFPTESYDIIAIMTKFEMRSSPDSIYHDDGVAVMKGACLVRHARKFVGGVSIFRDNGVFSGIHNAAHEFGHLLGSGDAFRTENCSPTLGFVMSSPLVFTSNSSDFSKCSKISFNLNFQRQNLKCLYNIPPQQELPNFMPGRLKGLRAQCNAQGYGEPCRDDAKICLKIHCLNKEGVCTEARLPALDGTKCHNTLNMVSVIKTRFLGVWIMFF